MRARREFSPDGRPGKRLFVPDLHSAGLRRGGESLFPSAWFGPETQIARPDLPVNAQAGPISANSGLENSRVSFTRFQE